MNETLGRDVFFPQDGNFKRKFMSERLRDLVVKEAQLIGHYGPGRKSVLDAGCGDARNSIRLVRGFKVVPNRLVLFENDAPHLALACQNAQQTISATPIYSGSQGDIYNMPFIDGCFDLVIGLGDVPSLSGGDPLDALSEMRRVLSDDGILLFSLITQEYLEHLAERDFDQDCYTRVRETHILPINYGDGTVILHVSLGATADVPARLAEIGLVIRHCLEVRFDFKDIPARLLLACAKK